MTGIHSQQQKLRRFEKKQFPCLPLPYSWRPTFRCSHFCHPVHAFPVLHLLPGKTFSSLKKKIEKKRKDDLPPAPPFLGSSDSPSFLLAAFPFRVFVFLFLCFSAVPPCRKGLILFLKRGEKKIFSLFDWGEGGGGPKFCPLLSSDAISNFFLLLFLHPSPSVAPGPKFEVQREEEGGDEIFLIKRIRGHLPISPQRRVGVP